MRLESTAGRNGGTRALHRAVLLAAWACAAAAAVGLAWTATPAEGPAGPSEDREVQKEVREIATMLRAPCCPNLTVSQHNSPVTMKMKREITEMVKAGKGKSEIVATLRAEYGEVIAPSIIPELWKPYLWVGVPIVLLALLALLGRWLTAHEKAPTVLHMEGGAERGKGPKVRAA